MQMNLPKRSAGFTLVEIAIVLVIIGLLLGGVLKGQEMIENGRVRSAINDMNGVLAAYNGYLDRFRRMPGDDGTVLATLQARGGSWADITVVGDLDGLLDVTAAQVFTGAGEGAAFWQHLKAAGLIAGNAGDAGAAALPRNAFNGLIGVGVGVTGMPGARAICLSEVPGKHARTMDTQLDDGVPDAGALRATQGVAGANTAPGAAAAAYSDDNVYTLCRTL